MRALGSSDGIVVGFSVGILVVSEPLPLPEPADGTSVCLPAFGARLDAYVFKCASTRLEHAQLWLSRVRYGVLGGKKSSR